MISSFKDLIFRGNKYYMASTFEPNTVLFVYYFNEFVDLTSNLRDAQPFSEHYFYLIDKISNCFVILEDKEPATLQRLLLDERFYVFVCIPLLRNLNLYIPQLSSISINNSNSVFWDFFETIIRPQDFVFRFEDFGVYQIVNLEESILFKDPIRSSLITPNSSEISVFNHLPYYKLKVRNLGNSQNFKEVWKSILIDKLLDVYRNYFLDSDESWANFEIEILLRQGLVSSEDPLSNFASELTKKEIPYILELIRKWQVLILKETGESINGC